MYVCMYVCMYVGQCTECYDSDGHHLWLSKRNRGRLRGDHAAHGAL